MAKPCQVRMVSAALKKLEEEKSKQNEENKTEDKNGRK
jgi:hypothetical protein